MLMCICLCSVYNCDWWIRRARVCVCVFEAATTCEPERVNWRCDLESRCIAAPLLFANSDLRPGLSDVSVRSWCALNSLGRSSLCTCYHLLSSLLLLVSWLFWILNLDWRFFACAAFIVIGELFFGCWLWDLFGCRFFGAWVWKTGTTELGEFTFFLLLSSCYYNWNQVFLCVYCLIIINGKNRENVRLFKSIYWVLIDIFWV